MRNLPARPQWIWLRYLGCAGLALTVLAGSTVRVAMAQGAIKKITYVDHRQDKFAVENMLRSGADIAPADKAKFDNYFLEYVLPPLGNEGPAELKADLPELRNELKRYFRVANGAAYQQLANLVREFTNFVVRNVNDPACRVNALIALGDLNEFEGSGTRPPKPLPAALNDLISLLKARNLPDYMRTACMVGALRHAQSHAVYPISEDARTELSAVALAMLKESKPPARRLPSAHAYLRRQAADVLGALGDVGKNGENVTAVLAAMQEKDTPLSFRLGLCGVLGSFVYPQNFKIDYKQAMVAVFNPVVEAGDRELARSMELEERRGGFVPPDRRRLSYVFRQALLALQGTAPRGDRSGLVGAATAVKDPQQATLSSLAGKIRKTLSDIDKEGTQIDPVEIEDLLESIKQALPKVRSNDKLPREADGKEEAGRSRDDVAAVPGE